MFREEGNQQAAAIAGHDDVAEEDINEIWSTFRLPIPIPKENSRQNQKCDRSKWLLNVVDQLRLLQTMKEQYSTTSSIGMSSPRAVSINHRRMKGQINLAYAGQARIEQTFPTPPIDDTAGQSLFNKNAQLLIYTMRKETDDICNKFHDWLNRYPTDQQMQDNVIYKTFFAPLEPVNQDEPLCDFSDEEGDYDDDEDYDDFDNDDALEHNNDKKFQAPSQNRSHSSSSRKASIAIKQQQKPRRSEDIDPVEFQKQQQELLEEELASMATRLKTSTLAMNATLQTQTKDLESMEDIAQANLDNVSLTTKKVEDRLAKKKGWKKRLATWSMIGTVVGMWVLCFMIMRTVPKRKVGKMPDYGLTKTWVKFLTEKSGQLKDRLNVLLHGESIDSHWEQARATNENERSRPKQQQRQPQYRHQRQEACEVLPDGSQVCREEDSYDNSDAKAQQLLAERKQRRIENNMVNAPTVDAIDPADIVATEVEDDTNNECIPYTPQMQKLQSSLEGIERARINLAEMFQTSQEASERRQKFINHLTTLHSDFLRLMTALEEAKERARADYWVGKDQQAVQDMPFCETDMDMAEFDQNQIAWTTLIERIKAEEEAQLHKEAEDARRLQEETAAAAKREAEEATARMKADEKAAAAAAAEARRREEEEAAAEARRRAAESKRIAKEEEASAAEVRKRAEEVATAAAEANKRVEEEAAAAAKKDEEEAPEEAKRATDRRQRQEQQSEEDRSEDESQEQNRYAAIREEVEIEAKKAREAAKQFEDEVFMAADVRYAASKGQNDLLAYYISERPNWIHAKDRNGWLALHEAARAGNLVGVELLVSAGCDLSSRTGRNGNGGTALWWALQQYGENHDVVSLLRSHNALEAGPETAR